jgi:hypothetical protein
LEGTGYGLTEILSWDLPGGTEENHYTLQNNQSLDWYLNGATPGYRLPLDQLSHLGSKINAVLHPDDHTIAT